MEEKKDPIDMLHEYILKYAKIVCEEEKKKGKRRKKMKEHYLMIVKKGRE